MCSITHRSIGVIVTCAFLFMPGCAAPVSGPATTTQPAGPAHQAAASTTGDEWAPLPLPAGFDLKKARLTLAQVPDDPPAPAKSTAAKGDELPRQALVRIEEAKRLFAEQRYSETVQELERALRYNVETPDVHRLMALALLLSGNEEQARTAAEKALALRPNDLACHYILGRAADKARKTDDALREYRIALKCLPATGEESYRLLVNYHLGNLLFEESYDQATIDQLSAFESGLRALGDKVSENPELASLARVHRGEAADKAAVAQGRLGNYAAAAESLRVAVAQTPKDNTLRTGYVRMLGRAGKMTEAASEAERLVADTNGSKESIELLVAVHRRSGHPERAVEIIKRMAVAQPENIELWKVYVDALTAAKQFDQAVAALNELVSRHPDASYSRWRLVQMSAERGEWSVWLTTLSQHLKSQPADGKRVREEVSRVPVDMARKIVAEAQKPNGNHKLVPPEPADAETAAAMDCVLSWLAARTDDSKQAAAFLAAAAKRSPNFLPATVGAVEEQVQASRWKDAIQAAQANQDRKETSAVLERLLGQAYDGLDDFDAAAEHYKKAFELDKNDIDSMLRLGQLYDRAGKVKEAERQFQFAVGTAENDLRAREALVRHYVKSNTNNEDNKAVQAAADMHRIAPQDPATVRCVALVAQEAQPLPDRKAYVEALRKLVQASPNDVQSRHDLIEGLLDIHEYVAARAEAVELAKQTPNSAETGELLAKTDLGVLNFAGAIQDLQKSLSIFPNRETLLLPLAQAGLIQQDYDTSVATYHRLLALKQPVRERDDFRRGLLLAFRQAGRFDDARAAIESWIKGANAAELRRLRQYFLFIDSAAGDNQRYVARCREWLKTDPNDDEVRTLLLGSQARSGGMRVVDLLLGLVDVSHATGLVGMGRYDEATILALQWLNEKTEEEPARNNTVAHAMLGTARLVNIFLAAGRNAEAIEVAKSAVSGSRNPDERLLAQRMLFDVYLGAKKTDEAIALGRELAADANRDTFELDRQLISLLSMAGRNDEAISHANRLVDDIEKQKDRFSEMLEKETNPQRRNALRLYVDAFNSRQSLVLRTVSYAYQRAGQRSVAEERLQEAYKLDPTDAGINNDYGYLMADSGKNLAEAEKMVRQAVAEEPLTAAYQDSLGWVYYKKGQFEEAFRWLHRATSMDGGRDPVVYDHLADTQWRLGRKDEAVKNWNESLRIQDMEVREGSTEMEVDLPARVKAKLVLAAEGKAATVAPTAAESQPAR